MKVTQLKSGKCTSIESFNAAIVELEGKYKTHCGGRCQFVFGVKEPYQTFYAHMN